ncbi:MAG: hypothetical protein CSB23_03030 [Deltaproteobacteria bacterium]|nr:MAG: hypothetical protein CSB23_03030 [Deltaproteobacteria bacterium]
MMRLFCPYCGLEGVAEDSLFNSKVSCPDCEGRFIAECSVIPDNDQGAFVRIVCPHCSLRGTAENTLYQKKIVCPDCDKKFALDESVLEDSSQKEILFAVSSAGSEQKPVVAGLALDSEEDAALSSESFTEYFLEVEEQRTTSGLAEGQEKVVSSLELSDDEVGAEDPSPADGSIADVTSLLSEVEGIPEKGGDEDVFEVGGEDVVFESEPAGEKDHGSPAVCSICGCSLDGKEEAADGGGLCADCQAISSEVLSNEKQTRKRGFFARLFRRNSKKKKEDDILDSSDSLQKEPVSEE